MLLNNDPYAIFRVDWITVDTVIIILLVILLILVKVYKASARWRNRFSNSALEEYKYEPSGVILKEQTSIVKGFRLIRNKIVLKEDLNKPIIVFLRTNYRKKIIRILTEGLASYHFHVVQIHLSANHSNILKKSHSVIPRIIKFLQENKMVPNSNYILIHCEKSKVEILNSELEVLSVDTHKRSFKNYETILLGNIINKIENA